MAARLQTVEGRSRTSVAMGGGLHARADATEANWRKKPIAATGKPSSKLTLALALAQPGRRKRRRTDRSCRVFAAAEVGENWQPPELPVNGNDLIATRRKAGPLSATC